jgi:hypothetical protein
MDLGLQARLDPLGGEVLTLLPLDQRLGLQSKLVAGVLLQALLDELQALVKVLRSFTQRVASS